MAAEGGRARSKQMDSESQGLGGQLCLILV